MGADDRNQLAGCLPMSLSEVSSSECLPSSSVSVVTSSCSLKVDRSVLASCFLGPEGFVLQVAFFHSTSSGTLLLRSASVSGLRDLGVIWPDDWLLGSCSPF